MARDAVVPAPISMAASREAACTVARGLVDDVIMEGPDDAPELILFIHAELVEGLAVCVVQCINC